MADAAILPADPRCFQAGAFLPARPRRAEAAHPDAAEVPAEDGQRIAGRRVVRSLWVGGAAAGLLVLVGLAGHRDAPWMRAERDRLAMDQLVVPPPPAPCGTAWDRRCETPLTRVDRAQQHSVRQAQMLARR